jgi:anaphase-promoting complex subunit 5
MVDEQGESLASVFENVVKSFYLNVTRNLRTIMGPQLLLESSLFTRIGKSNFHL